MDPILGTLILAWVLKGAWDYLTAQAGAETRRAREVITVHVRDHRERLYRRIEHGRGQGPAQAWWWAWAGLRSARALHRGMRGLWRPPSPSERRALSSNSVLRRLLAALMAGARAGARRGREEFDTRRGRRGLLAAWWGTFAHGWGNLWHGLGNQFRRRQGPELGVCDNCGAVVAQAALQPETHHNGVRLVCPNCRHSRGDDRPDDDRPDEAPPPPPPPLPPVTSWDDPLPPPREPVPVGQRPAGQNGGPVAGEVLPSATPPTWPKPAGWDDPPAAVPAAASTVSPERPYWLRFLDSPQGSEAAQRGLLLGFTSPETRTEYVERISMESLTAGGPPFKEGVDYDTGAPGDGHPAGQPQIPDSGTAPVPQLTNGSPNGGNAVPSNLPAPQTGNGVSQHGGETYTHGAWQQHIGVIRACLDAFPQALDRMLAALRAEEVGRRQAEGVIAYADHVGAVASVIGEIITTVDGKVMPVVDTTAAAGGPDDVNDRRYYREM